MTSEVEIIRELNDVVAGGDTENEIVEPYEQRLEMRDGRMAKCRMVVGSPLRG